MPVDFKLSSLITGLLLSILLLVAGCASTPKPPSQPSVTPLQLRSMQTRTYSDVEPTTAIKAVMAALQDEGYIISDADKELGFIHASKELYSVDGSTKAVAEFTNGSGSGTYQTTIKTEATATVREYGKELKVRINLVEKSVSNSGGNIWSQPVQRPKLYQDIFTKVDNALYLEKNKM